MAKGVKNQSHRKDFSCPRGDRFVPGLKTKGEQTFGFPEAPGIQIATVTGARPRRGFCVGSRDLRS